MKVRFLRKYLLSFICRVISGWRR